MLKRFFFSRHLEDDEVLLKVVHKHWLIGLAALFWPTLLAAGGFFLLYRTDSRPLFIGLSVLLVVVLVRWLRNFFDYYLDAWLVTDRGIVDIAWHGWFHRQSTRVLFSDVQGVSYEIKGVLGTLLRYGTLSVEKISTGTAISLEYVKRPRMIEGLMLQSMEAYLHSKNLKDAKRVQELLSELVVGKMQEEEMAVKTDQ